MNICNLAFNYHLVCNDIALKYVCLTAMSWGHIRTLIMGPLILWSVPGLHSLKWKFILEYMI
jgi:hypothetical protein